ncbi:MAG: response regulator transcription factor [Candidatus Omnitrophota bacterium]
MKTILIVEDDKHILTGLVDNLEAEGYKTATATDGEMALIEAKEKRPDLIILDIMLPKLSGFEVCKELKKEGISIPIIILSAKAQEPDKIMGLELGADDYVTKPFSPRELIVRVKAVLRRVAAPEMIKDVYEFDGVKIDFKKYQALKDGKELKFTAAEYKILKILIKFKGEPISRHKILSEIWTAENVTTRTIDTHIWSLREKLEKDPSDPKHIITVHRIGYKFVE